MSTYNEGSEIAGRFVVGEKIGAGGMGAVYRALQTSLDRQVALKVLHSDKAFTARARRRFGREARAIARLNHPHIAGVYDFGADNDEQTLWLAMELVDGFSTSRLKREDVDILRLASLTDQVLSALSAAHARGIIHRDLKPSNILVTRDDDDREVIKLVDFGLAATQTGKLNLQGAPGGLGSEKSEAAENKVILGTPRYMAPEIFRRKPLDPRVDLYALGVILFEILSGQPPYPGDDPKQVMKAHLNEPIPQLEVRNGRELPAELERCIYQMLAKHPADRIQSAAEARESIQIVINQFSYVPWMVTGPQTGGTSAMSHPGNMSGAGFLSGYGGRTVPPAAMRANQSDFGVHTTQQPPLVGRVDERRSIEKHVRRAVEQSAGGLVFVEGPAGAGKSRLIEWIRVRVEESGVMRVAQGHYSQSMSGFGGVRAVIESVLGTEDASYDQLPYMVRTRLERWGFSEAEVDLAVRLMQPSGEEAVFEPGDFDGGRATARRERVFGVVEKILRRAAADKPLLVLLEDLHHAGEPTATFLEHLAVGLQFDPAALVVVGSIQSDELRTTPHLTGVLDRLTDVGSEEVLRVRLDRMSDAEIVALVENLAPIESSTASEIAARVSGNPLHATALLGYLEDSGKLIYDSGSWVLADGIDIDEEIPAEIADMMRYRARQVLQDADDPAAMKAFWERAAILGRRFDYRLFRSMLTREHGQPYVEMLDPALEVLVHEGVLREDGHTGEDILAFDHVLMREVMLQDMESRRSVRRLHQLAAEAKIDFYADRIDAHAEEIAEHFRRARAPDGVYVYTLKAARAAANASDLNLAMQLYREAESLADSAQADGLDGVLAEASYVLQSEEVALEVAHLERRVGEYDSARTHYRQLLGGDNLLVGLWARWGLGKLAERRGDLPEAKGWFDAVRRDVRNARSAGRSDGVKQLDAFALCALGGIALKQVDFSTALELLDQAIGRADDLQEPALQADALRLKATVCARTGATDDVERCTRRATMLVDRIDDAELTGRVQMNLASLLADMGQPRRAFAMLDEALETAEELNADHLRAECLGQLGVLDWRAGRFKRAAGRLRKAHAAFGELDDRSGVTRCKFHLATLALTIGRHKETVSLGGDALDGFGRLDDRWGAAHCRLLLSRLHRQLGKHQSALTLVEQAGDAFDAFGDVQGRLSSRAVEALVREEMGDHDRVDRLVASILSDPALSTASTEHAAVALEELGRLLNRRDPGLAIEIDEYAEGAYSRLGRSSSARSSSALT